VRPIVGDRVARFRTTLEDVIDAAPDRPEAMRQVRDYLGSDEAVDAAMNQRLGNLFGVGFGSSAATFSPFSEPTTEKILDAFDYLGQSASWNPATRTTAALFDKRLDGRTDVAGQIDALKAHKTVDVAGRRAGDVLATQHGQLLRAVNLTDEAKQLLGADTMFSREGNDLALRLATGKPSHTDLAILAESPELDEWLQNWDAYRKNAIVRAEIQGLRLNEYQDAFGNEFNPRYAQEFDFGPVGKGTGQLDRAATIENMYSRNPDLALPGGDIELREISLLPMVREHAMRKTDSPFTDEDVGEEIARYIADRHGNPMITDAQGTGIARVMRKLNPNLPADTPAFSEHPINAQMRYMVNTEMRLATANHVYDSMAEAAKPGKFTQQSGGIYRSVDEVLGKYSGRLGFETTGKFNRPRRVVAEQLRARIAVRVINPLCEFIAHPRDGVRHLGATGRRLTKPERDIRRLAGGIGHPQSGALHPQHPPGGVAQLKDIAGHAVNGEVFIHGADDMPLRFGHDVVVGGIRDRAATGKRGKPRAAPGPRHAVHAIHVQPGATSTVRKAVALAQHGDHGVKLLAGQIAIRPGAATQRVERIEFPVARGHFGHNLLGEHIECGSGHGDAIEFAAPGHVEQCGAFHQLVARLRKQSPLGDGADAMTRSPDALQEHRERARGAQLADEIHLANIDPQFQRRGGHQRLEFTTLQALLGEQAPFARHAAVMRTDGVFPQAIGQRFCHAFRQPAGVDEHQRGAMVANQRRHPVVDIR
jgi:hypothetical protein